MNTVSPRVLFQVWTNGLDMSSSHFTKSAVVRTPVKSGVIKATSLFLWEAQVCDVSFFFYVHIPTHCVIAPKPAPASSGDIKTAVQTNYRDTVCYKLLTALLCADFKEQFRHD